MARVVMKNVMKRYANHVVAVRDFDMCIEDREFVVFVGPSGSGKTTALRMIAGLEDITEGEIYFDDLLVNNMQPKDRDIAMVFQNYALYPHMTVFDNMSFALRLKKTPKSEIRRRVNEAALALGIEDLLARKPRELSGGQRQRVALGRATVRQPRLFLMDEPLSNLDAKLRVQMRAEISRLHYHLQTTFIYVTHDQTEAMTMGNRIVVMNEGRIQQVDSPQRLYEKPANLFVAGFIGSPPMNLKETIVFKQNEGVYLKLGNSCINLPASQGQMVEKLGYINKEIIMGIRPENMCEPAAFNESR
ncbi:MAG: ATP-binding cassette domain-containing protein, partial [Syntrophomonas sp.]